MVERIQDPNIYKSKVVSGCSVVDFYAVWCGPCRRFAPEFEKLEKEYPSWNFYTVNIDDDPMKETADNLDIASIPTVVIYKNGEVIFNKPGAEIGPIRSVLGQN